MSKQEPEKELEKVVTEKEEEEPEELEEELGEGEEEGSEETDKKLDKLIDKAINERFPQRKARTIPKHIRRKEEEPDSDVEEPLTCYRCHQPLILTDKGLYCCRFCRRLYSA